MAQPTGYCAFCGRVASDEVRLVASGDRSVAICAQCVELATDILSDTSVSDHLGDAALSPWSLVQVDGVEYEWRHCRALRGDEPVRLLYIRLRAGGPEAGQILAIDVLPTAKDAIAAIRDFLPYLHGQ